MGYNIFSFAINVSNIKQAIGSKDAALYDAVMKTKAFDSYNEQSFDGGIPTKFALKDIIFGNPYNENAPHSYWYAFITLCDYLGESLPASHEINLGYETDFINSYLASDFGVNLSIENVLLTGPDPFGLPAPEDWPLVGLLDTDALEQLRTQLQNITITEEQLEELQDEDEEKEMAYDSIKQIKENVAWCLDNGMQMISFCH